MAIALDASVDGGIVYATSLTYSHTCSGTDRILFVSAFGDAADDITGATYGGASMTLVGKNKVGSDRWVYLFVKFAPATGANNVVISGASTIVIQSHAVSYTGADQFGVLDSYTSGNSATTTYAISTTVVAANSWTIAAFRTDSSGATAGTGSTQRRAAGGLYTADSNGPLAAGSRSMEYTNGNAAGFSAVIASFAPSTGGGGSAFVPQVIMVL